MAKTYNQLDNGHLEFIKSQHIFFVATAPLSASGSVNLSPIGYDSLHVVDEKTVLWIDLGGYGVETIAHLGENQRITLMFCAFEGPPNILRIYGEGEVVSMDDEGFAELLAQFPKFDRARAIIKISIHRVMDSCGWGVPFYDFKGERDQLQRYLEHKPIPEWKKYRYEKNVESIDGLPGLINNSFQIKKVDNDEQ